MKNKKTNNDPYALYRHLTFQYLHYYLEDFIHTHPVKQLTLREDAGFGGHTLSSLLAGKDMHLNCYLRLLTVMREYCEDDDEYIHFILGFIKRGIIEIWLLWEEEPTQWMLETWKEMQQEKSKYNTSNS